MTRDCPAALNRRALEVKPRPFIDIVLTRITDIRQDSEYLARLQALFIESQTQLPFERHTECHSASAKISSVI